MKYIDADKLLAEIERQIEEEKNNITEETKLYYGARQQVRSKILHIINELQQERPSLPSNLDEAAKRIAYDVCKQLPNGEEKDGIVYYAILAAIAGAEWMAGQISKAE